MQRDKNRLKCSCTDGSLSNGIREPILSSFGLSKPRGFTVFGQPESSHFKKETNL